MAPAGRRASAAAPVPAEPAVWSSRVAPSERDRHVDAAGHRGELPLPFLDGEPRDDLEAAGLLAELRRGEPGRVAVPPDHRGRLAYRHAAGADPDIAAVRLVVVLVPDGVFPRVVQHVIG